MKDLMIVSSIVLFIFVTTVVYQVANIIQMGA